MQPSAKDFVLADLSQVLTLPTHLKQQAATSEFLRFADLPNAIKLAREAGMTNQQIARLLTGSTTYSEARQTAAKAAPLLGISVAEFMKLRKND